jgi:nucleotide-binding universal stress UspA family protein
MKSSNLPKTDSIEELARFWDSHEITEFENQLEEVSEPVFEHRRERMILRLRPDEAQAVEEIAKARGADQTDLLHEWLLEKIDAMRARNLDRELTSILQKPLEETPNERLAPEKTPSVFVSHSIKDELLANELAKALDDEKIDYWIDHKLRAGDAWMEEIGLALERASIFLLLISPEFMATKWGAFEIEVALRRAEESNALIVPVLVRDTVIPTSMSRFNSFDARSLTPRELCNRVNQLVQKVKRTASQG